MTPVCVCFLDEIIMKNILIVDDEKDIRDFFEEIFRNDFGFENITLSKDGVEATAECLKQKFDLITLDHNMPGLKGADLLKELRTNPGINQHTPVIMISACLPDLPESIKSLENIFMLEKPVSMKKLKKYLELSLVQTL